MKIQMMPVDELKPYERNPRHNADAVDAVAASIQQFGFRQPLVVTADRVIVIGHTRWLAAKKLALATVPVHVAEGLTEAQIKALRIADNQTATLAEWDMDLLPLELKDLQGLDFNLDLLGFSAEDLASMLSPEGTVAGNTDPDAVPEPPDEPVTRPGDLWLLGRVVRCPKCRRLTHV